MSNSERNKFEQLSISSFIFPLENPSFTLIKLLLSMDRLSIMLLLMTNLFKRFYPDFDVSLTTLFALIKSDRHPSYKWPANRLKNRTNVKTRGFSFSNLFHAQQNHSTRNYDRCQFSATVIKIEYNENYGIKNRKMILKSQEYSVSLFLDFLELVDGLPDAGFLNLSNLIVTFEKLSMGSNLRS